MWNSKLKDAFKNFWRENKQKQNVYKEIRNILGTSLVVQWLRLCTSNAGGMGSIPGQETKIPCAAWCGKRKKERKKEKKVFKETNINFLISNIVGW